MFRMINLLSLTLLPLLTAGCVAPQQGVDFGRTATADWTYKPNSGVGLDDGPMALFGFPYTLASAIFSCAPAVNALEFATLDSDIFEGTRLLAIDAGGVRWSGHEQLDPPDAVAVARAFIPLGHPLIPALENGAGTLIVSRAGAVGHVPNHPIIRRLIEECRAKTGSRS